MYKRVLLKLSGEQLAGKFESGIDPEIAAFFAEEIKKLVGSFEVVLVIGGGNMVRGAQVAGHGIKRVTAEQMGMLSGLVNSIAVTDIFESLGVPTRCLSNIFAPQVAESYSFRLAEKHLQKGRALIVAGGLGRPYFTHDSAAVNLGLELSCDVVMKATKYDGVFESDPATNPQAKKLESLSFQDALHDDAIKVMDKAALGLAMEHHMPIVIFDAMQPDRIARAAAGEPLGTKIG